ncbi:uncharacterized protein LOC132691459 isoform X1 [Panthera onca]
MGPRSAELSQRLQAHTREQEAACTRWTRFPSKDQSTFESFSERRPEVFTEDPRGDRGTVSANKELRAPASQEDGMRAAIESGAPLTVVLSSEDHPEGRPRTWLGGEGGGGTVQSSTLCVAQAWSTVSYRRHSFLMSRSPHCLKDGAV